MRHFIDIAEMLSEFLYLYRYWHAKCVESQLSNIKKSYYSLKHLSPMQSVQVSRNIKMLQVLILLCMLNNKKKPT